jgi:hypothetical protein
MRRFLIGRETFRSCDKIYGETNYKINISTGDNNHAEES